MRIKVPPHVMQRALNPVAGAYVEWVVDLGLPELALTEQQMLENNIAFVHGQPIPHKNKNFVSILLPAMPRTHL